MSPCEEATALLLERALDTLETDTRARLVAHLGECEACRALGPVLDDVLAAEKSGTLAAPAGSWEKIRAALPPADEVPGHLGFRPKVEALQVLIVVGLVAILVIASVCSFKNALENTFDKSTTTIDTKITQQIK